MSFFSVFRKEEYVKNSVVSRVQATRINFMFKGYLESSLALYHFSGLPFITPEIKSSRTPVA